MRNIDTGKVWQPERIKKNQKPGKMKNRTERCCQNMVANDVNAENKLTISSCTVIDIL